MKLDKAIKILKEIPFPLKNVLEYDQQDAIKLGIEALKRLEHDREYSTCFPHDPLPGEDP